MGGGLTLTGVAPEAIGTEIRLGCSTRENARTKARRLLVEGRVLVRRVDEQGALAHVRGDSGAVRIVTFGLGRWFCDCPAKGDTCSHVRAVASVVVVPG